MTQTHNIDAQPAPVDDSIDDEWRPADTLPDWAIRHRRRVVSIDAGHDAAGVWQWRIETEEVEA